MPYISKKKLENIHRCADNLFQELERVKKNAYLIGVEREGKKNVFTFVRGERVYQLKTTGAISDDIPAWKENLLR